MLCNLFRHTCSERVQLVKSKAAQQSSFTAQCHLWTVFRQPMLCADIMKTESYAIVQIHMQAASAAGQSEAAAQSSSLAQSHALTVFRRPMLGASPRLSSAFELPPVVGALGYSLSPVQVSSLAGY